MYSWISYFFGGSVVLCLPIIFLCMCRKYRETENEEESIQYNKESYNMDVKCKEKMQEMGKHFQEMKRIWLDLIRNMQERTTLKRLAEHNEYLRKDVGLESHPELTADEGLTQALHMELQNVQNCFDAVEEHIKNCLNLMIDRQRKGWTAVCEINEDLRLMKITKPEHFGQVPYPKPLKNLKNTCFMNAILQVFCASPGVGPSLGMQFKLSKEKGQGAEFPMTRAMFDLLCYGAGIYPDVFGEPSEILPLCIVQEASKHIERFGQFLQQDSHDMFCTILSAIDDEMKKIPIEDADTTAGQSALALNKTKLLYTGHFLTVYCSECMVDGQTVIHVNTSYQPFISIQVPVLLAKAAKNGTSTYDGTRNEEKTRTGEMSLPARTAESPQSFNDQNVNDHAGGGAPIERGSQDGTSVDDKQNYPQIQSCENAIGLDLTHQPKATLVPTKQVSPSNKNDFTFYEEKNIAGGENTNLQNGTSVDKEKCPSSKMEERNESMKQVAVLEPLSTISEYATDVEKGLADGLMNVEVFEEIECRRCHSVGKCSKKTMVARLPFILVLQIQRFGQVELGSNRVGVEKLTNFVSYPERFEPSFLCSKIVAETLGDTDREKRKLYNLFGVIAHSGDTKRGHYIAYIKKHPRIMATCLSDVLEKEWNDSEKLKKSIELFLQKAEYNVDHTQRNPETPPQEQLENKRMQSEWLKISDSSIYKCSAKKAVENKDAYLLFYEMEDVAG